MKDSKHRIYVKTTNDTHQAADWEALSNGGYGVRVLNAGSITHVDSFAGFAALIALNNSRNAYTLICSHDDARIHPCLYVAGAGLGIKTASENAIDCYREALWGGHVLHALCP